MEAEELVRTAQSITNQRLENGEESEDFITEELEEEKQVLEEVLPPKKRQTGSVQENSSHSPKEQPLNPEDSTVNLVFTLSPKQIAAFQHAFENFRRSRGDKINRDDLQFSLNTMNIYLSRQDTLEALKSADIDKDGRVSFRDFMTVLTDDNRFTMYMESKSLHPRALTTSENLDIVLFDAMQIMVTKDFLPGRSMAEILCYYLKKYRDSVRLTLRRKSTQYGSIHAFQSIVKNEFPPIMGVTETKIRKLQEKLEAEEAGETVPELQREVNKLT